MTGKHLIIDASGIRSVFVLTDLTHTYNFLRSIPILVNLKPLGPPWVVLAFDPTADGVTGIQPMEFLRGIYGHQILTTSHVAIHLWSNGERAGIAHLDVFSCRDFDEREVICEFERVYQPEQIEQDVRRRM